MSADDRTSATLGSPRGEGWLVRLARWTRGAVVDRPGMVAGVITHGLSRSPRLWRMGTGLLVTALLVETASLVGTTAYVGLVVFG